MPPGSFFGSVVVLVLAIVGATWHLATRLEKMEREIGEITRNHLPHIQKQFRWLYVKIQEFERLLKEGKK